MSRRMARADRWPSSPALMFMEKFQDMAVEGFGLLPIDRVRSFGKNDKFGAGNTRELAAHHPGRALQVLISGHQQRRYVNRRALVESNSRALRLRRRAFLLRIVVNLQPPFKTLGIGRHVPRADLAKLRRPAPESRKGDLLAQL